MESSMILWLVLVGCTAIAARPQAPQPPPGEFPPVPPLLAQLLPAEAVEKLKAIHADRALGFLEKQQAIDRVMVEQPAEVLDRIPPPPGFDKLPADVQTQLKAINRSRALGWQQKQEKLRDLIHSLPAHLRSILMPPMPPQGRR